MDHYVDKASEYLKALCDVKPNRRTGSSGNREATDFFEKTIRKYGYDIDAASFATLDYVCHDTSLTYGEHSYAVYVSPYSLGCDITAEIITVSTVEELENADCEGKILLLKGAICEEQLAPKNFVFYNPEHHKQMIALLESKKPGGIITATKENPDLAGALCPFPLFVDGDFDIPSVYCLDTVADEMQTLTDKKFRLRIDAKRIPSSSSNVLARLNSGKAEKIVITAHIDAYESTPGALDNASGIVVLLLAAEMLADYRGKYSVEILAINGEDHYSAAGEMDYLRRYGNEIQRIAVVINIDDAGFKQGKSDYSFYECSSELEALAESVFRKYDGLERGEQWYAGDHMVFVQNQVPAIAVTSERMPELLKTVTHTSADTPDLVDCQKLVEIAMVLNDVVRTL
ncbi:MAG TPA: M28 family peptidase [Spirochaetales bacterium]|nr:M28 family peptidase [Spirochaetales bacterium]